jgi:hypothetical protein
MNIAKKMTEFKEEEELFNFDMVLILLFESKRGALNATCSIASMFKDSMT